MRPTADRELLPAISAGGRCSRPVPVPGNAVGDAWLWLMRDHLFSTDDVGQLAPVGTRRHRGATLIRRPDLSGGDPDVQTARWGYERESERAPGSACSTAPASSARVETPIFRKMLRRW